MKSKLIFLLLLIPCLCFADFGQPVGNVNVNLNPQATTTPSANMIPKAYPSGYLDSGWFPGYGSLFPVMPQTYANLVTGGVVGAGQDDTPAFAAAAATGLDLYIPDGSYKISSITLSRVTQSIFGQSSQLTVLTGTNSSKTIITTPSNWTGAIKHLQLTRASQVTQGSGANGITVATGSVGIIDDVYTINSDIGIYHSGVQYGSWVLNCVCTYCATASFYAVDPNISYWNCGSGNSYRAFYATSAGHGNGGYFLYGCTGFQSQTNNVLVQGSIGGGKIAAIIIEGFVSSGTATGAGIELDYAILAQVKNCHVEWSGVGSVSGGVVNWSVPTSGVPGIVATANTSEISVNECEVVGSTGNGVWMLGSDFQVTNNRIVGSSYGYSGSSSAIAIPNASSNFQVIGNKTISAVYTTYQVYGLYLGSNLNTNILVSDNIFGGTVEGIYTAGVSGYPAGIVSGVATNKIHDNIGTIPAIAQPSAPGSNVAFANPYAQTCYVLVAGGGAVSLIAVNGANLVNSSPFYVVLKPGDTITFSYAGAAPGWWWNPL